MKRAILLILIVALLAGSGVAQTDGPPGPCQQAAIWHLHQAMRFSQAEDQGFHRGAAAAAQDLAALGDDCSGWDEDAARPGILGDSSASGIDAMQQEARAT